MKWLLDLINVQKNMMFSKFDFIYLFIYLFYFYKKLKVETKADSSYMIVSGIQERNQQRRVSVGVNSFLNKLIIFNICCLKVGIKYYEFVNSR